MKILLIGSGGRESALAWKLAQSKKVTTIYVTPGNAGTENIKKCCNVSLHSIDEYLTFAKDNKVDLTIVGPEQPLVDGVVDLFQKNKLNIFGPNHQAAMLEGSKIFSKNFMQRFNVTTASYNTFTSHFTALAYVKKAKFPLVIKANGLAAGKGVEICKNFKDAQNTITKFMVDGLFKEASRSIVIEEFLKGTEASIICITDGKTMVPLVSAQDHKTIFDGNKGPNTGGMGAVAPNPYVTKEVMKDFVDNIMNPTLAGIKKEKFNFHGFVFFGVMITKKGCKCLEYNVRMGDPECQSIVPLMDFDLYQMFVDTLKNKLGNFKFKWKKGTAINVVMTSRGYPGTFNKGNKILIKNSPLVFIGGAVNKNNEMYTNGGRVLSVVAIESSLKQAHSKVYKEINNVHFEGAHYRKDIGLN